MIPDKEKPFQLQCNYCGEPYSQLIGHRCIYTDLAMLATKVVELEIKVKELTAQKTMEE